MRISRKKSDLGVRLNRRPPKGGLSFTGFTLLELLIAASILTIVGVAVSSVFFTGIKVYKITRNYGARQADILLFIEKMEQDLRNTFYFSGAVFTGDVKTVTFAGPPLSKITYRFDDKNNLLIREEQSFGGVFANEAKSITPKKTVFIKDISFSYLNFTSQIQQYDWKDSWQSGSSIPKAVRIKAVFKKDDNQDVEVTRTVLIPVSG